MESGHRRDRESSRGRRRQQRHSLPPPPMDPKMTEVTQMFARFKAAYARNDLDACVTLLSQLKVHLTKFPSLPPSFQQTPNAVEELKLARDIYEHAVVLSVKLEDQDAFERDFCQLKPYYMDTWLVLVTQFVDFICLIITLVSNFFRLNSCEL